MSHLLDEVLELADRVTVLRDGRVVAAGLPVAELDQESLVELIVGRAIDQLYPPAPTSRGRAVLDLIGVVGITLRGVTLRVHEGEVFGVAGLVGSGRDELCGSVFGLTPRFAGRVLVDKTKVFASPRDSIDAGMAMVPADRKHLGLVPNDRLAEHISLPRLGPLERGPRLDHRAERRDVAEWVDRVDVQPPLLRRRMEKFSGGNQQKAVLARWLRTDPDVLLLDEPTQGVDVGSKAGIYRLIVDAAQRGVAVVVASSDTEELVHVCDRVVVMRAGVIAAELEGPSLTEARLVAETLGATSMRGTTRLRRRSVRMKVIRHSDELDGAEVTGPRASVPAPAMSRPPSRWSRIGDRIRGMFRGAP